VAVCSKEWVCSCLLACWDCELESRHGRGCLSVVSAVCCQVVVWSLVQRSPTKCGVSEYDHAALAHYWLLHHRKKKNKRNYIRSACLMKVCYDSYSEHPNIMHQSQASYKWSTLLWDSKKSYFACGSDETERGMGCKKSHLIRNVCM